MPLRYTPSPMAPKKDSLWYHILDVALNIVIIVAIVVGVRTFLVSPFQVEGTSMLDTLEHREYIVINKFVYFIGKPQRGDVVVFRPPHDRKNYYVKRIIGLPGDEVIIRGGYVYLRKGGEGEEAQLPEDYLNERNKGHTFRHPPSTGNTAEIRYTVPEGRYFLLGDNRQGSQDSRSFAAEAGSAKEAYVKESDIKGKVWFIALPITKIHALEPPEYGL